MLAVFKKHLKNRKGFTLVELMAVVVIIGILIAIAIPVYNNIQEGVKQRADEATLRALNGAAQAWAMSKTPPADLKNLESDITMSTGFLVDKGFIEPNNEDGDDVEPQSEGSVFEWDDDSGAFKLKLTDQPGEGSGVE